MWIKMEGFCWTILMKSDVVMMKIWSLFAEFKPTLSTRLNIYILKDSVVGELVKYHEQRWKNIFRLTEREHRPSQSTPAFISRIACSVQPQGGVTFLLQHKQSRSSDQSNSHLSSPQREGKPEKCKDETRGRPSRVYAVRYVEMI